MGVKIFAGRASQHLAKRIADAYGQTLGNVNVNVFSDGEFQPSLEETVRGQDVFIVQSTICLLYTSPSPRDRTRSRMPSSA